MSNNKPGRPPKGIDTGRFTSSTPNYASPPKEETFEELVKRKDYLASLPHTIKEEEMTNKVGNFIVINTINVKGLRINLDKVFSYAFNGDSAIQVAQGDGNNTTLNLPSREEALNVMAAIDEKCL